MSGAACAAVIVSRQARSAATVTESFARESLLTPEQEAQVVECSNQYIAELNAIAAAIPNPKK